MIKTVFFFLLIMAILLISIVLIVSQFVPTVDLFLFGQPTLQCKPCICHPECHCETKCVQQQIMKECNLGVDNHNALVSHHTQENRITRIILIFSLVVNFLQKLFLLFRKSVRHCYRSHRTRQRQQQEVQQQATARYQAERYTVALKQMLNTHAEQPTTTHPSPPRQDVTSSPPLLSFLSNIKTDT